MVDGALFLEQTEANLTRLYQAAYGILRTRQDAEDAVQQALMKAWAARLGARPETFVPWLMRIVINECRNIQRRRRWALPLEAAATRGEAFAPPDPDLWAAVGSLPESLRLPFTLKYVSRLTEREVAQAMRLPVSTVKNRLAKARRTLRAALAGWEVSFE